MSPRHSSHDHHHHQAQYQHSKKEIMMNGSKCPSSLKIHKDSHFIAKSSSSSPPSSSSSSATSLIAAAKTIPKPQHFQQQQLQQRHPVIIYTHSPKVIHTNPRDFMALVQKLTGQSCDDMQSANKGNGIVEGDQKNYCTQKNNSIRSGGKGNFGGTDENESSSVVTTDENCGSSLGDGQVNSGLFQPYWNTPSHNYYTNMPLIPMNNNMEYVCPNPPLFNFNESLYFNPPDIRSSIYSSTLEAMNDFRGH